MADREPLSPTELDRLEDGLESLDGAGLPTDLPSTVAEQLAEYRALTRAIREALPEVDPPAHIFDRVVNEARTQAARPVTRLASAEDSTVALSSPRRRVWSWLRLAVPGAALAGVGALVLWWARPQVEGIGQPQMVVEPGAVPAISPGEPVPGPTSESALPPALPPVLDDEPMATQGAKQGEAPASSMAEPEARDRPGQGAATKPADQPTSPTPDRSAAKSSRSPQPSRKAEGGPDRPMTGAGGAGPADSAYGPSSPPRSEAETAPGQASTPESLPTDATVTRAAVDNAHALRRRGRCGLARLTYEKAIRSGNPSIRAHGYAGLGLCDEAEGRDGSAALSRARRSDPRIHDFIRDERASMR